MAVVFDNDDLDKFREAWVADFEKQEYPVTFAMKLEQLFRELIREILIEELNKRYGGFPP